MGGVSLSFTTMEYATAVFYTASLACYLWKLFREGKWAGRVATMLLAAGLATHYLALMERARSIHAVPYEDLYGSMSLLAWFLVLTYLGLELMHGERAMGAFVLPLVLVLLSLQLVREPHAAAAAPARGSIFALHVTSEILAYSAFTLSFVYSVVYLVQDRLLRGRKPVAMMWRLPSLDDLEQMARSGVWVGLASLMVGIGFGMLVNRGLTGALLRLDPKVVTSFVVLGFYAVYLIVSRSPAWRGARASILCVASYCVVIFSYTVVNLFLSRFHRFF